MKNYIIILAILTMCLVGCQTETKKTRLRLSTDSMRMLRLIMVEDAIPYAVLKLEKMSSPAYKEALGLKENDTLRLGEAIPATYIRVDEIIKAEGKLPQPLSDFSYSTVIFPVYNGNVMIAGIEQFEDEAITANTTITRIMAEKRKQLAQKYKIQERDIFAIEIPGLNLYFLACYEKDSKYFDDLKIFPLWDSSQLGCREADVLNVKVFEKIYKMAIEMEGNVI